MTVEVADDAQRMGAPTRVLEPALELRASGTLGARVVVETALQTVVDEDVLDLVVLEPVLEQRPLSRQIELRRVEATKGARHVAAGALVVAEIGVASALMAAMAA